jgi:hypothetical protein
MDESAFEVYSEWLYHRHIAIDDSEFEELHRFPLESLFHQYWLGLHVEDWKFCDAVLQSIVEYCVETSVVPTAEMVSLIYEKTPGPCRLRRFVVGLYMHVEETDWLVEDAWEDKYPGEFSRDVMLAMWRKNPPDEDEWNTTTLNARLCVDEGHAD